MAVEDSTRHNARFIDMTGKVFGKLTILEYSHTKGTARWLCRCECGTEKVIEGGSIRRGVIVSCGCYGASQRLKATKTHGMSGKDKKTSGYVSWQEMKSRCYSPNASFYEYYGGRGIKVCDRWRDSFENFHEDMGDKPTEQHTLDRIDSNGDYEPSNCRWATRKEQLRNTRRTVLLTYNGRTQCMKDWAKEAGIDHRTFRYRVVNWGIAKAMETPVNHQCRGAR